MNASARTLPSPRAASVRANEATPTPERPVVFRYLDARKFLADAFEHAKSVSTVWSHRYIAKAMNASSSGFFKDILNGRVRISAGRAVKFAKLFKLAPAEAAHFETLVLYTQAESGEEKDRLLSRLGAGPSGRNNVLDAFQLEYFRKWHYAAVREILALGTVRDTEEDAARLAALFDPPLTTAQVRDALRLLLKLKMIRRNAQGLLERTEAIVRSGKLQDPALIRPALRGNIELALRALDAFPAAVRPFSYLTLSVSDTAAIQIRDKIAALRREILEIAARDTRVDRLYQLNFQMFPLTRNVAENVSDERMTRKKATRKNLTAAHPGAPASSKTRKTVRSGRTAKTAPGGQS